MKEGYLMIIYNVAGPEHLGCKKGRGEEIVSKSQEWVTSFTPERQNYVSAI